MISNPIKNILKEFDDIFRKLEEDKETSNLLNNNVSEDIKSLKLWRDEIETNKQSIYIIGKTSTGKSKFLNFLLGKNNTKDDIFKTSTAVETGIIQTLEHCEKKDNAYAEIIIKDKEEFKKLTISGNIKHKLKNNSVKIYLSNSESISFFRDKIIAKSEQNSSFNVMTAVEQVNIKYPLNYFKNHKIIDTPGLASSISSTDKIVKENFYGKSHILWFLDASSMNSQLKLLEEWQEQLNISADRIHFIANKFDLMDYENDNNSQDEVLKTKQELTNSLRETLINILGINNINPKIIFISLEKTEKMYANTVKEIKSLEENLLSDKKESNYKNIISLIATMKEVLEKIKDNVILKNKEEIDAKLDKLKFDKKGILSEKETMVKQKAETFEIIEKAKKNINNIKKEKELNTHERYNKYVGEFKTEVSSYCSKIENSVKRMEDLDLNDFYKKVNQIKRIKDLSLQGEEGFMKKYFVDKELWGARDYIKRYVYKKLDEFTSLTDILNETVKRYKVIKESDIEKDISSLSDKKENIENISDIITKIKQKVSNIDKYLLEDIENRVDEWNPQKSDVNNIVLSFLELYSLLEEYKIIKSKKGQNE